MKDLARWSFFVNVAILLATLAGLSFIALQTSHTARQARLQTRIAAASLRTGLVQQAVENCRERLESVGAGASLRSTDAQLNEAVAALSEADFPTVEDRLDSALAGASDLCPDETRGIPGETDFGPLVDTISP